MPVQVRHAVGVLVQDLAALAEAEDGLLAVAGHLRGVGRVQLHARALRHRTLTEIIINSMVSKSSPQLARTDTENGIAKVPVFNMSHSVPLCIRNVKICKKMLTMYL